MNNNQFIAKDQAIYSKKELLNVTKVLKYYDINYYFKNDTLYFHPKELDTTLFWSITNKAFDANWLINHTKS